MRPFAAVPALLLLAACSGGGEAEDQNILNATAQMDPAAAAAVENAVANGVEPQNALAIGGQAATPAAEPSRADRGQPAPPPLQARPNLPASPNRPDGSAPPEKMISNGQMTGVPGSSDLPNER